VWLVTALQGERGRQVLLQQWGLLYLRQQGSVDRLLVGNSLSLDLLLWLLLVEEVSLGLLGLWSLLSGKVLNVVLGNINTRNRHLGGGGNDVTGVDSSQWNTVDLERTGDQQGVVLQLLQEDNSLTSETTSQQDQDGTWNDRGTQLVWVSGLSGLLSDGRVCTWVPLWLLEMLV